MMYVNKEYTFAASFVFPGAEKVGDLFDFLEFVEVRTEVTGKDLLKLARKRWVEYIFVGVRGTGTLIVATDGKNELYAKTFGHYNYNSRDVVYTLVSKKLLDSVKKVIDLSDFELYLLYDEDRYVLPPLLFKNDDEWVLVMPYALENYLDLMHEVGRVFDAIRFYVTSWGEEKRTSGGDRNA